MPIWLHDVSIVSCSAVFTQPSPLETSHLILPWTPFPNGPCRAAPNSWKLPVSPAYMRLLWREGHV